MSIYKVIPNLYFSDLAAAQNLKLLKSNNITHIVQVMGDVKPAYPDTIKYKIIPVVDQPHEAIILHFNPTTRWMLKAIQSGGNVLVHW